MDTRVRGRYVRDGKISRDDVEKNMKALPDLADRCEAIDYEEKFASDFAESERAQEAEAAPEAPPAAPAPGIGGLGGGTFGGTPGL